MQIKTISVHKYHEYLDTVHEKEFLQSDYQGVKFSQRGWEVEYIEAIKDGKTVAFSMIACMPLMKVFKYCYIPRGFFMDYHSKEDVISFTSSLKAYLKKRNVIYAEIDPSIEFVQRDKDGNIVEGGYNNFDVVENLKAAGFLHLPMKPGYDISKECRWVSVLNLKGKTKEEIFKEFSYQTRQDIRTYEKYCVKTRVLNEDQLDILDEMEKETSERQDFEAMSLDFYKDLYHFYGKSHIETVLSYLPAENHLLLVHNIYTSKHDVQKIHTMRSEGKTWFVLCPASNCYIENRLPDIAMLRKSGIPICLGTDSLSSNHELSVLNEISYIQYFFPEITFTELISWATRNGAAALKIDHRYGTIEPGKQPGINLISGLEPETFRVLPSARVKRLF